MLLRSSKFLLVYTGQLFSLLADNFYLIALPWLVLKATGSTLALGSVFALAAFPRALLLPFGGVWADRIGQRRIMFVASLVRGFVLLGLAAFLAQDKVWALYPAAFLLGTASAFYYPAEGSIIPRIVTSEQLPSANSLVQGTTQLLGILGPALGGVAVGLLGGEDTLLVAAGSYALAAIMLLFLRLQKTSVAERASFFSQLTEGIRVVWEDPALRWLILIIAFSNFGFVGPFFVGIPTLVRETFGLGAEAFGTLTAAFSLGSLGGISLAALTGKLKIKGKLAVIAMVITNLGIGLLFLASNFTLSLGLLIVAGIGSGMQNILLITLLQLRTPKALLGRVMSLILVGSFGLSPLSQFLAGTFAERFEVKLLFPVGAMISLAALLLGARWIIRLEPHNQATL